MPDYVDPEDIVFGLDSFGDLPTDEHGDTLTHAEAIRQVLDEVELADKLGVDVIALGEHHRPEYSISAPDVVLSAIASRTDSIKLSSGVTVLSSDDPVRVFERFATLDAVSNGRAEIILGRGSFTESFPLFGFDLENYDELFDEKIALLSELLKEDSVDWDGGEFTTDLDGADVYPKTESGQIKTWVGVGGSPQSVIRAVRYGFPVIFAIIGGSTQRFKPYLDLYEEATEEYQTASQPIGVHSPGFIGESDSSAQEAAFPYFKEQMDRVGEDRGWRPMSRGHFNDEVRDGALYVGSAETVAEKIADTIKLLGLGRFDMIYGFGPVTTEERMRMVKLYGKEVIPTVKQILKADGQYQYDE